MIDGYARVSTDGQSVDTKVPQLRAAGCKKVFRDAASGTMAERPQLREIFATLGKPDSGLPSSKG